MISTLMLAGLLAVGVVTPTVQLPSLYDIGTDGTKYCLKADADESEEIPYEGTGIDPYEFGELTYDRPEAVGLDDPFDESIVRHAGRALVASPWTDDTDYFEINLVCDSILSIEIIPESFDSRFSYYLVDLNDNDILEYGTPFDTISDGSIGSQLTIENELTGGSYLLAVFFEWGNGGSSDLSFAYDAYFYVQPRVLSSSLDIRDLYFDYGVDGAIWEADPFPYRLEDSISMLDSYPLPSGSSLYYSSLYEDLDSLSNGMVLAKVIYLWDRPSFLSLASGIGDLVLQLEETINENIDECRLNASISEGLDGLFDLTVFVLSLAGEEIASTAIDSLSSFAASIFQSLICGQFQDIISLMQVQTALVALRTRLLGDANDNGTFSPVAIRFFYDVDLNHFSFMPTVDYIRLEGSALSLEETTLSSIPPGAVTPGRIYYFRDSIANRFLSHDTESLESGATISIEGTLGLNEGCTIQDVEVRESVYYTFTAASSAPFSCYVDQIGSSLFELTVDILEEDSGGSTPPIVLWGSSYEFPRAGETIGNKAYTDFYLESGQTALIKVKRIDESPGYPDPGLSVSSDVSLHQTHQYKRVNGDLRCWCGHEIPFIYSRPTL